MTPTKPRYSTPVKQRLEFNFVKPFIENWILICKSKGYNIAAFCRIHNTSQRVIYALKAGNHERSLTLGYYAHLASLHNLTILDVLNYKPVDISNDKS